MYFTALNLSQKKCCSVHIAHFLAKLFWLLKLPGSSKFSQMLLATNGEIDMFVMR